MNGSDWKKELYKAARTTVVTISNETDFVLQRISVKLQQGLLRLFPPEIIGPNNKIEFASESNAFVTGTKGCVIYLVLPPSVAPIQASQIQSLSHLVNMKLWEPFLFVTIEWSNPYWTNHSASITSQSPLEVKYFLSHEEINRQIHSEARMHIKGKSTFKIHRLFNGDGQLVGSNTGGGNKPASPVGVPNSNNNNNTSPQIVPSSPSHNNNSNPASPNLSHQTSTTPSRLSGVYPLTSTLSFFSSLSSGSPVSSFPWSGSHGTSHEGEQMNWKHAVKRATRGQFIVIVNRTNRLLIRRDYVLDNGSWCELPPEGIPPNSTIEFGTASGLCTGTDGSVYYYSNGLKGDFKLSFNNPFIGENTFSFHCPPQYAIEKSVIPGTISTVTFTIIDKSSQSSMMNNSSGNLHQLSNQQLNNSNNSMNSSINNLLSASLSSTNITVKDENIRIISLNVGLLSSSMVTPEDRTEHIANNLINMPEKYDIICLQELFSHQAKEKLNRVLRATYPYIIDKSGEDSGLYFASSFPILWSDFRLFNEGIGLDVHSSKGVQGVKLDISAVKENSVLYVFNAHLQSNPVDGSVAWQMVSGDDKQKKAQTVRTLQLQSIRDFISTELSMQNKQSNSGGNNRVNTHNLNSSSSSSGSMGSSTSGSGAKKSIGLVLCGDMNIVGEVEQVISDEGSVVLSQIIPDVAKKINSKEITATFSHQLLDRILSNNIPMRYLGILRQQVVNPRMKSLILAEMITFTIKKEIVELLSQLLNRNRDIVGNGGPVIDDETTYRNIVLETLNRVFHYDTKESKDYWVNLKRRLRSEFASALTELEELDFVDLRSHVINLQLLTSLKESLELTLQTKSIYQLIRGSRFGSNLPSPLIVAENIEEIILPPLTSYWGLENQNSDIYYVSSLDLLNSTSGMNQTKLSTSSNNNNNNSEEENGNNNNSTRIKIYLKPTDEYESLKTILGNPVDLFRSANPHQPGYTIHQSLNQMVTKMSAKERIDYIFSFNLSPHFGDYDSNGGYHLLRLNCLESSIRPLGATPQTRLSDHFAVECVLKVEDPLPSSPTINSSNLNRKSMNHNRNGSRG